MRLREKAGIEMLFKGPRITLEFDKTEAEEIINFFGSIKAGVEYDLIKKERARRSLNANAYYWQLVRKIAEANGMGLYETHNRLMVDYGTDWLNEVGERTYVMMKDDDRYLKSETTHYRPTDHTEDKHGVPYRWFILLTPSHLMDKTEMARLINGATQEAAALEIPCRKDVNSLLEKWGA